MIPPSPLEYQTSYESDAEIFAEDVRNLRTSAKDVARFADLQEWIKSQIQLSVKRTNDRLKPREQQLGIK